MSRVYVSDVFLALIILFVSFLGEAAADNDFLANDLRLDGEGQVVVIDPNGAELYLDYIGDPRTESEKIKVTINDPDIKITSGSQCAIKNPSRDCKIVLRYKNINNPSYGQKTLSVLDSKDSLIKSYAIWIKPNKDEEEIPWDLMSGTVTGPIIVQNSTDVTGGYRWSQIRQRSIPSQDISFSRREQFTTDPFYLPSKSLCYIDKNLSPLIYKGRMKRSRDSFPSGVFGLKSLGSNIFMYDYVKAESNGSFNVLYSTGNNNISSCATEGIKDCVNLWGSWTVGLMNLSGKTLRDSGHIMRPGEIKYQDNRAWDSGSTIYWTKNWAQERVALFTIHGTTDGSDFDPTNTTPPVQAVQTAPPCSKYLNKPKPAERRVTLTTTGPGDVIEERGFRTVSNFSTLWVVDDGSLFVVTAVPNEGHQFIGWSGATCDNKSLTCSINITSDITIKAEFK